MSVKSAFRYAACVTLFGLSSCTITRYVRIPCLTQEQLEQRRKAEPVKVGGNLTGDAQKDVRIIGGSAKELRVWGEGNLSILGGCAAPIDAR